MIIHRIHEIEDLSSCWDELLSQSRDNCFFLKYYWIKTYWDCYHEGKRLYLLTAQENNEIIGIAPLMIDTMNIRGMIKFKVIRFLGTGPSDYLGFILLKNEESIILNEFINYLKKHKDDWDLIWMSEVPAESCTHQLLPNTFQRYSIHYNLRVNNRCPMVELPEDWPRYLSSLSKTTKKKVKNLYNRLTHDGIYNIDFVDREGDIDCKMDSFFKMNEERWRREGERGHQRTDQFKAFHKKAANRLKSYLMLVFIRLNEKPIAALYCYDYEKRRYFYASAMDMDYYRYSPTFVLISQMIKDAIENKLKIFDFMRGDEEYKYHFAKKHSMNIRYIGSHSFFKHLLFKVIERISNIL